MAAFVFTDPHVTINSVDLSDHVVSVEMTYEAEAAEATRAGHTVRSALGGLKVIGLSVTFQQDYATGEVDATLFSIVGSAVAVAVRPVNTTISASNPEYQTTLMLQSYPPVGGNVTDNNANQVTAVFVSAGTALTRDVTP